MRVENQPKGVDLVIEAVHALDEAKKARLEVEAALEAAKAKESQAEALLREVIAVGRCDHTSPAPVARPAGLNGSASPKSDGQLRIILGDRAIPICWRIAWMLVSDPQLDYQSTAEAIWGSGLDKTVAKNRVNAQVTRLKKLGVAKSLGSNRFQIDQERLEALYKLPAPGEATP